MDFYALLDQVLDLLRQRGRVTCRALKRQFDLDDVVLEDLKAEIIEAHRLASDAEGTMLVWTGDAVGYFEQALSALPHLPKQREMHGQAIDLRLALRSALIQLRALGHILPYLREAEALAADLDDRRRLGSPPRCAIPCPPRLVPAELGTFADGRALGDEGLRIAEAVAHLGSLMFASWGMGLLTLRQGGLHRALPLLERAMSICREADLPNYFPRMAAALGPAYTLAGRVGDAVPLLTQAVEPTTALERVDFQAFCRLSLGEAQMLAGRLEEAHALAKHTLALTRELQERGHEAYALRLLGDIEGRRERPENARAEAHYHQTLTLAEELGMRPLQAHCHLGLGTLDAKIDQREQARAELSAAINLYGAMDMTFWLPQAEAALAQVA